MEILSANAKRWLFALIVLLVVTVSIYLSGWAYNVLRACGNILALYFTAWLLQFFFSPIVDVLTRHRLPRVVAVSYVYLVLALVVVIAGVAIVPNAYNQGKQLASTLGNESTYHVIANAANGVEHFLVDRLHVPPTDIKQFTHDYSVSLQNGALSAGTQVQQFIKRYLTTSTIGTGANTVFSIFNTISNALVDFILVLLLAFYMTLDGQKLMRRALAYFPPVVGEVMEGVGVIVNRKFGGYLRGQIILAVSYGLLTYIIAVSFSLQVPIFIAVFAGVMMLIPFIGTFAAIIPPIIFFIVGNPSFPVPRFLLLIVFLIASQQIVLNLLAPRVMGSAVGLHPLLVVLGLLLGIKVAGLWGAIFGVPVFGVILDTIDLIYRRVMERRFGFHPLAADGQPRREQTRPAPGAPPPERGSLEDEPEDAPTVPRASAALQPSRSPREYRS